MGIFRLTLIQSPLGFGNLTMRWRMPSRYGMILPAADVAVLVHVGQPRRGHAQGAPCSVVGVAFWSWALPGAELYEPRM